MAYPSDYHPVAIPEKVVELRIHGVAGTPPEGLLKKPPVLVAGDEKSGFYRADPHYAQLPPEPDYDFGAPVHFETQGARLKSTLRRKVSTTKSEFGRLIRDRMRGLLARFRS